MEYYLPHRKKRYYQAGKFSRLPKLLCALLLLFMPFHHLLAQTGVVKGRVSSGDTALANVTVQVKGKAVSTQTNANGDYTITASPNSTLVFTSIGYATQEVNVDNRSSINISLLNSSAQLDQVVVVGYGTQRRKDVTGSISSVTAAQIEKVPVNTIDQALQGRATGVQVVNNDGRPGGGVTIQIRGVGSLGTNGNEPLYVIDGYPTTGGINNINPNDIATIDILKDASAASIYGIRAANGVVIITTKRGKKDGVQVSLDLTNSIQSTPKKYDVLNAQQFSAMVKEITADPSQGSFTPLPEWNNPSSLVSVDWQDALYRTGLKQNYNLGVRGGNEKVQTAFSAGYNDHKGIVLGSYFKRINLGLNLDYTIAKWLKSSTSAKYARQDQNTPFGTGGLQQLTELIPTITGNKLTNQIKDANGNYGFYNPINIYTKSWGNPLYDIESRDYVNRNNYFLANTSLEATLLPGLRLKTNIGANVSDYSGYYFQPEDRRWDQQYGLGGANQDALYSQSANNTFEWVWENTLAYTRAFGQHNIDVVAGVSAQENQYRYISAQGNKQINNALRDIAQVQNLTATGSQGTTTFASQFGRINYRFSDKYYLTGTVRRDGVSKFARGNEYGIFPSVSAAWRIKGEQFMESADWITDLKLRGGYGILGNQGPINPFQYENLFSTGGPGSSGNNVGYTFNGVYQPGLAPVQPANPGLKWETDYTTNVGFDATFMKGALTLTVDYYNRRSKDFLLNLPQSSQTGYSQNLAQNVGEIQNKGFEFALNYNKTARNFTYGVGLTFTTVDNKLLSINKALTFIDNLVTVNGLNANGWNQFSRTNIGQPIGEFFGYQSIGIIQTQAQIDALNAAAKLKNPNTPFYQKSTTGPGDRLFADVNGDGHVDATDRTSLGSPIPKFFGGLNLDATYKRFDFNIYLYGTSGNKIFNYQMRMLESFQAPGFVGVQNVGTEYFNNHWTPTNPSNRYTRFTYNDDVIASNVPSSQYVEDGSYLRLKSLQVGYTVPAQSLGTFAIPKIRLFVSTQNLFTITSYSGLDPEIGVSGGSATAAGIDPGSYPLSRFYTLGLNVNF
jgi:TonB-linked SusC/RagA family outer membrane protein